VVIFGVCNVMPAKQDYDWAPDYISRAEAKGWQLVYVQRNYVDLGKPWEFFNNPPVGLFFVDWKTQTTLRDGRRAIATLSASRSRPPTETFNAIDAYDCSGRTYAFVLVDQAGGVDEAALLTAERRAVPQADEGNATVALLDAVCAR
jgi:hypothetical protein